MPLSLRDPNVVAVVVGDGRTPRTAALLAMRTRWTVWSIDPALHGLGTEQQPIEANYSILQKGDRHPKTQSQEQGSKQQQQRRQMKAQVQGINRLMVMPAKVQEASVPVSAGWRVVVILPHAHVSPDDAIACLDFEDPSPVSLSVLQLPCCGFLWHKTALGEGPDSELMDSRIATACRVVRVWKDLSPFYTKEVATKGASATEDYRRRIKQERRNARRGHADHSHLMTKRRGAHAVSKVICQDTRACPTTSC